MYGFRNTLQTLSILNSLYQSQGGFSLAPDLLTDQMVVATVNLFGTMSFIPNLPSSVQYFSMHTNSGFLDLTNSFLPISGGFGGGNTAIVSIEMTGVPSLRSVAPDLLSPANQTPISLLSFTIEGAVFPSLSSDLFRYTPNIQDVDLTQNPQMLCSSIAALQQSLVAINPSVHFDVDSTCEATVAPFVAPGSLRLFYSAGPVPAYVPCAVVQTAGSSSSHVNCVIPSTLGVEFLFLSFDGAGFDTSTGANMQVEFGVTARGLADLVPCPVLPAFSNSTHVVCSPPAGVGANLPLRVTVRGLQSNASADTVSYAAPVLYPNTLSRTGSSAQYSVLPAAPENFGAESITFSGAYLWKTDFQEIVTATSDDPLAALVKVWYGPVGEPARFECKLYAVDVASITCNVAPDGFGQSLRFTVSIAGQNATGTDVYNYYSQPIIKSASGCSDLTPAGDSGTIDCPTNAVQSGVKLTVRGEGLYAPLLVLVKGEVCNNVTYAPFGVSISCELPDGTGRDVSVLIFQNGVVSAQPDSKTVPVLVSYALPSILSLEDASVGGGGCAAAGGGSLVDCPRLGNSSVTGAAITLTVHGANFGGSGAQVLIGAVVCENVIHDPAAAHSKLTCTLPHGGGTAQTVVVIAFAGDSSALNQKSNRVTVSYRACAAGTAPVLDAGGGFLPACAVCPAATANNGTSICVPCDRGLYSNETGLAVCLPCPVGTFSSVIGATACSVCRGSDYQTQPASISCLNCGSGYFAHPPSAASGVGRCVETCPAFASCSDKGVNADADYWLTRESNGQIAAFACLPNYCLAGTSAACITERGNNSDPYLLGTCCAENRLPARENPLCGRCVDGHIEWRGQCIICDGTNGGLVVAVLLLAWAYVIVLHVTSQSADPKTQILFYAVQMVYLQLSPYNTQFLSALSVVSVDFMHTPPQCIAPIGPRTTMALQLVIPVLCFGLLGVTRLLNWCFIHIRSRLCTDSYPTADVPSAIAALRISYTRTVCGLFLFTYSQLSSTSLAFVQCTSAGDQFRSVVRSAPAIGCYDSDYNQFAPLFYTVLVLCAAAPVMLLVWLYRNRQLIAGSGAEAGGVIVSVDFRMRFGVFFSVYRPGCYWYAVVVLTRRFALAICVAVLLDAPRQLFALLAFLNLLSVVIHVLLLPYPTAFYNRVELCTLLGLTSLAVFLTAVTIPFSTAVEAVFGVFVVLPLALFGLYIVYDFIRKCREPNAGIDDAGGAKPPRGEALNASGGGGVSDAVDVELPASAHYELMSDHRSNSAHSLN